MGDRLALHVDYRVGSSPNWIRDFWRIGSMPSAIMTDFVPLADSQWALIGRLDRERSASLMRALDACNARWGRSAVVPARAGLERQRRGWATKFEMRTTRYTTRVEEMPVARA